METQPQAVFLSGGEELALLGCAVTSNASGFLLLLLSLLCTDIMELGTCFPG